MVFLLLSMAVPLSAQFSEAWHVLLPYPMYSGEDLLLQADGEMTVCGTSCFTARYDGSGAMLWQRDSLMADSIGFCAKLLPTVDGGTFAVGDYEDHTGTDNLVGFHQDIAGTLLGTTIVNTPGLNTGDEFHDAAQDSEGNIYLTGEFALNFNASAGLAKLDPDGELLWQVVLPPPPTWLFGQGYAVGCAGDTLIYVLARNSVGCSLLRYTSEGILIGSTDLGVYIEHNAFAVDEEGNAVFGGGHDNHFNITKMLPTGAVLWSFDLDYPIPSASSYISDITCDGNGNIYAAGSAGSLQYGLLTKISPSGIQLWSDTTEAYYPTPSYFARHRGRMLLHGDRLTLATLYTAAHLYEYDTLGNRLSRQALDVDGNTGPRVNALRKDDEGDLYITGFLPSGQSQVGFLAKYTPDISTGMPEHVRARPSIYPVPCTDQLQVEGLPDGTAVYVEDANGRIVLHANLHAGALDVGVLPNGPYLLRTPDGSGARFVKVGR
jgi:hypothetical protein